MAQLIDNWCISKVECFTIHFVKYMNVVGASDGCFAHYINSFAEFILCIPHPMTCRRLWQGSHKTARDVMTVKPLPHLLRVGKT